jgi:hypothetical protein
VCSRVCVACQPSYSNTGFALLGRFLEKVHGRSGALPRPLQAVLLWCPSHHGQGCCVCVRVCVCACVCRSTWEDYIAGNIFKPLGMGNTTTAPPADLSTLGEGGVALLLVSTACVS